MNISKTTTGKTVKPRREPPPLRPGDRVGIIAPASPLKAEYRERGLAEIRRLGYEPVEAGEMLGNAAPWDFLSRSSEQSLAEIRDFFADAGIRALWAARGGYGSNHLLPLLGELGVEQPKIVIGSSDISYLLWYLSDRFDMVVYYGPMAFSTLPDGRYDAENLKRVLGGDFRGLEIPGRVVFPGRVRAPVTGGCLSNLVSLLGTPFFPEIDGRVLLLEDVGERPYRLDRMLWQLWQGGVFSRIRGLILGQFPGCFKDEREEMNFWQRLEKYVQCDEGGDGGGGFLPVLSGLPFGHGTCLQTLPLGAEMEIDTAVFSGLRLGKTSKI